MLPTLLRATALALLWASSVAARTVSLASFVPRIDKLPSACNTVYFTTISGCIPGDFSPGATCSAACVRGLGQIAVSVKRRCADVDAGELSIIGVFQNDLGIPSLCPGITVTTITPNPPTSSTPPSRIPTSAQAPSTKAKPTSSSSATDSGGDDDEPASSSPSSSSSPSPRPSTTGLARDPNATASSPTMTVVVPPQDTRRPEPTLAPGSQLSNTFSGGGSPFDVVAAGKASHQEIFGGAAAALLATTLLLAICA